MYNTSGWNDQLVRIDISGNVPCDNEDGYCWCTNSVFNSYNSIGHPTVHKGSYLSWSNGKNLASYDGTSFTYASTGMRLTKGNNTTYEYEGDKLIKETRGTTKIEYLHGANGIIGFRYSGRDFYYVKNAFGDVTTVVDWYGDVFAKYVYDAFGNCTITQDTNGIGTHNPIRYRSYYYDTETGLYYLKTRYYDPEIGRFISPDSTKYLDPESIHGLNLYAYCLNNPVMYVDETGTMPKWAKWVVGGLAITGLIVATVLTFGAAGAGAATVGAAMLTGGLVSAGINAIDQLHDTGTIDWTELAISALSGTAYGLVVGLTGGTGAWSVAGKFAVAGGTSLLNSWNNDSTLGETMKSLGLSLLLSGAAQALGYIAPKMFSKIPNSPSKSNHLSKLGNIGSKLWSIPAIKSGAMRFLGGVGSSIFNDIF